MRNKLMIRISVLSAILMFLILPLLSSPVAAAFTYTGSATTTNPLYPAPPTASASTPPPYVFVDATPRTATFSVTYTFMDQDGDGSTPSSFHSVTITAVKTSVTPQTSVSNTFSTNLNNGQTVTSTLSAIDTYTNAQRPVTWRVTITCFCQDLSPFRASPTATSTCWVTVP